MTIFTAARVQHNRNFGRGVFVQRPARVPFGPLPTEAAWVSGYALALDGIEADAPAEMSEFEAEAFAAGHEAGWREVDQDRMEWLIRHEEILDAMEDRYGRFEEAECAEMGSQLGHDDQDRPEPTPAGEYVAVMAHDEAHDQAHDDGPSHGFADELHAALGLPVLACPDDANDGAAEAGLAFAAGLADAMRAVDAPRKPRPITRHHRSVAARKARELARSA